MYVNVVYGQLQRRYCTTQECYLALESRRSTTTGRDKTLGEIVALPLLFAIYPSLVSPRYPPLFFPSSSPVVQLGLISTRKREIAIGADEYVYEAAVSIDTHSLSPFDFPQNRPCWTARACVVIPRLSLSPERYKRTGLISMSTILSVRTCSAERIKEPDRK